MTIDLWCLVANALWGWFLVQIEARGKTAKAGLAWNLSNRHEEPEMPAWIHRTRRAISNHKENFPFFLTAVVVVHLAGKADRVSAIASVVYVAARIAHGVLYTAGVTKIRSAAYLTGLVATLVILSRLFV
jgi:uncharacterized MAPEG superfamily protein